MFKHIYISIQTISFYYCILLDIFVMNHLTNLNLVYMKSTCFFFFLAIIEAQKLKNAGISIITIGIGLTDVNEITAMASQPDFVFTTNNFDVLSLINDDLLQITCDSE
jgi:von Willebrand factor type A domain